MKRPAPVIPDSEATRLALLPARIAFWRKFDAKIPEIAAHVAKLEAELEQATADDDRKDTP